MAIQPRESQAPIDSARRGLLRVAGALGLSSLALAGCASRVTPSGAGPAATTRDTAASGAAPGRDTAVPALRPGGRVAIVAPASAADGAALDAAEWLQARGYEVIAVPSGRAVLEHIGAGGPGAGLGLGAAFEPHLVKEDFAQLLG